jgi:hypothetical protein
LAHGDVLVRGANSVVDRDALLSCFSKADFFYWLRNPHQTDAFSAALQMRI